MSKLKLKIYSSLSLCSRSSITLLLLTLLAFSANSQTYTSVYNGVTYTSSQPYNLNIVYFVPNDVPLDASYKRRLSELMIWGQDFYKQNMIANGYGAKSFGMFREAANSNVAKIIVINGAYPSSAYPYSSSGQERAEVDAYFNANPAQKTSEHFLIISAAKELATLNLPFYGTGKYCYAIDYPGFDLQLMATPGTPEGAQFRKWYGGLIHELGHGLNLPHSHQTTSENNNALKGMNLMFAGNGSIGLSPTFINRAGSATLNNCQVFAASPATFYNGNNARVTSLHASYANGEIIVSGTYSSSIPVTDINIFQDPYATPSAGYYRVAWSVSPIGADSFYVKMPVSDVTNAASPNGQFNLQIELNVKNGEYAFSYFPFSYNNSVPTLNVDFDDKHCDALCCGWQETNIGTRAWGPTPGYVCYTASSSRIRLKTFSTIYYNEDAFPFAYRSLTGNGSIVARVKSVSTGTNDYGGVMLRNGLGAGDVYVGSGLIDTRGIYDQWRSSPGGSTGGGGTTPVSSPQWIKLQRSGNNISSFYSSNGTTWTPYQNYNLPFANTIYAGVFASTPTAGADMENVSVQQCTLPSGWQVANIGAVTSPGTACHTPATGNIHMESYGSGYPGSADQITYMYRPVTGNINIVARIKNVSDQWNTMGGLMLRNSLDANSLFVTTSALDTRGVFDTYRLTAGANSGWLPVTPWSWPSYLWLKLSRTGNSISSYYSSDGSNWTLYHTYTVPMNTTIYAGLVSAGMGQSSDIDQVWINGVSYSQSSLAQLSEKSSTIQVLPNPTRGELRVAGTDGQIIKGIRVLDFYGRLMQKQDGASVVIDISNLPAAMYMVEVMMESGEMVRSKITKM